jgi:hypothetical protein
MEVDVNNQNRSVDAPEKDLRIFLHHGKRHYSFKGHFISCADYGKYKSEGGDRDTIMFEHARSFDELFREEDEKRRKEENYPTIHNVKELIEYIFTLLPAKQTEKIKEQRSECKTMDNVIKLFPDIFQAILRLRYALDKRIEIDKEKEMASLERSLELSLPDVTEPRIYNPDAFLGEGIE